MEDIVLPQSYRLSNALLSIYWRENILSKFSKLEVTKESDIATEI